MTLLLRKVTRESPTASSSARVAVPPAVPSRADAVVTVEAEAEAVVEKVADSADPEPLLLMRTVTPSTLTELSVVVADKDTKVRLVRMDTLKIDARVTRSDVETARLATAEVAWATEEDPRKKKPLRVKLLLRRLKKLKLLKRKRKRRKKPLPLLRKKPRRRPSPRKKRKRRTLASPSMISLLTERPQTSRTRSEITRSSTRRTSKRTQMSRFTKLLSMIS